MEDDLAWEYLKVKPRKSKVDLYAETPGTEALPPPLIPLAPQQSNSMVGLCSDTLHIEFICDIVLVSFFRNEVYESYMIMYIFFVYSLIMLQRCVS